MKKIMKKWFVSFLCLFLVFSTLTGCNAKDQKTAKTNANGTEDKKEESSSENKEAKNKPVTIKIWHDGDEGIMSTIQQRVNDTLKDENITVSFEKKTGLTDQIKLYGNDAANGPDMYLYAQDSIGIFAEMGITSPITDVVDKSVLNDMLPVAVEAGNYKNDQYMVPIYFETLLFIYNKDLWQGDIPSTTEDLYRYMKDHTDTKSGTYAVVNQHSTAYNVAPMINGFGGYIIDKDANPGLLEQGTKDAITYNQKFAALQADGDYNTVTKLFNDKKATAIIGGPWLMSGIKEAGINVGFQALSSFTLPNGNPLAPYLGIQGVGIMKHAVEGKKEALARVLEVLSGPEVGIDLANKSSCAPANSKAYDDSVVSSNEMIVAMKDTANSAIPMPNIPEVSVMWGPTESLLAAVNKSQEDVNKASEKYQKEALTAIGDMK